MRKVGNWWNDTTRKLFPTPFREGIDSRRIGGGGVDTTCPLRSFSRERRVRERRGAAGGRRKDLWPHTGINIRKHCGGDIYMYMCICKLVASEIRGWSRSDSVGTPSGQSRLPRHPTIYGRDENPATITVSVGFMPSVTANFYPLQPSSISLSPFRIRMDASLPLLYRPILTGPRPLDQILPPEGFIFHGTENSVSTPWESCYGSLFLVENRDLFIKRKLKRNRLEIRMEEERCVVDEGIEASRSMGQGIGRKEDSYPWVRFISPANLGRGEKCLRSIIKNGSRV